MAHLRPGRGSTPGAACRTQAPRRWHRRRAGHLRLGGARAVCASAILPLASPGQGRPRVGQRLAGAGRGALPRARPLRRAGAQPPRLRGGAPAARHGAGPGQAGRAGVPAHRLLRADEPGPQDDAPGALLAPRADARRGGLRAVLPAGGRPRAPGSSRPWQEGRPQQQGQGQGQGGRRRRGPLRPAGSGVAAGGLREAGGAGGAPAARRLPDAARHVPAAVAAGAAGPALGAGHPPAVQGPAGQSGPSGPRGGCLRRQPPRSSARAAGASRVRARRGHHRGPLPLPHRRIFRAGAGSGPQPKPVAARILRVGRDRHCRRGRRHCDTRADPDGRGSSKPRAVALPILVHRDGAFPANSTRHGCKGHCARSRCHRSGGRWPVGRRPRLSSGQNDGIHRPPGRRQLDDHASA
mmetsp:Transcript_88800/g.259564  ORF Transcript_88800/g.259564 Transcript_88800/m.259564 type:complete len:409 (+) Transcript_88800:768-1994(+)